MGKATRLKVYRSQIGFVETIVAAPSQTAALAAWGVRQNLFAEGAAAVTTEEAAVAAARADPGQPLSRPAGSGGPFKREADAPTVPDAPVAERKAAAKAEAKSPPKPKAKKAEPPQPPDRRPLDAAEGELKALEHGQAEERAELERRQAALDAEASAARQRWRKAWKAAEAKVDKARKAFRRAGG